MRGLQWNLWNHFSHHFQIWLLQNHTLMLKKYCHVRTAAKKSTTEWVHTSVSTVLTVDSKYLTESLSTTLSRLSRSNLVATNMKTLTTKLEGTISLEESLLKINKFKQALIPVYLNCRSQTWICHRGRCWAQVLSPSERIQLQISQWKFQIMLLEEFLKHSDRSPELARYRMILLKSKVQIELLCCMMMLIQWSSHQAVLLGQHTILHSNLGTLILKDLVILW